MPLWDDKKIADGVVTTETAAKGAPFVAPADSTVLNPGQTYYSVDPSAKTTMEAVYTPTHLPLAEPRRVNFSGQDEIYNSEAMHKRIRRHFQGMVLNDAHMLPPAWFPEDGARPRFVCNAPDWDVFRYIVELSEPDVFQYELNRALNDVPGISRRLEREFNSASARRLATPSPYESEIHRMDSDVMSVPFAPDYYKGFVSDTRIRIALDGLPSAGVVELYDFQNRFPATNRVRVFLPISYSGNGKSDEVWIARRFEGETWRDEDYCIVQPDFTHHDLHGGALGRKMLSFDLFNHIQFHINSPTGGKLKNLDILLNGEQICLGDLSGGIKGTMLTPECPFDASDAIYNYKQSLIGHSNNAVLKYSINELGQAWKYKWLDKFDHGWCGTFNEYILDHATALYPDRPLEEYYDRNFFGAHRRLISPVRDSKDTFSFFKPTSWHDLGNVVKPGYKIRMLTNELPRDDIPIYHVTSFVSWSGGFSNRTIQNFKGLGGNQGGRVKIGNFICRYESVEENQRAPLGLYFLDPKEYIANTLPPYFEQAVVIGS